MNLLFNIGSQIITKITNSKKKTKPKLPELLLFYWINNLIIKTNSSLLRKANLIFNENEKNKINTKNIQNILNQQKEDLLHQIYEILSNYKKKFLIEKQFNYFINNYFNNAMYDILKTQKISTLKQLYVINLNENISVNSFIFNNKLFLSNQGDFSNKHRQVNKKLEEIKFKLKEKKIEMYKISRFKNIMNNNFSSKICNLNIYYLSTLILIDDFLSCDDII
jgi:guanylate kinase